MDTKDVPLHSGAPRNVEYGDPAKSTETPASIIREQTWTGRQGSTYTCEQSLEIWITFALHGMHRYPDAPEEVAYLRNPHRHLFQFKVSVSVTHDDREVEFHMLQNWCKGLYAQSILELDFKSCEMIARDLLGKLVDKYGNQRAYQVEVSEDGECGAVLKQQPYNVR